MYNILQNNITETKIISHNIDVNTNSEEYKKEIDKINEYMFTYMKAVSTLNEEQLKQLYTKSI